MSRQWVDCCCFVEVTQSPLPPQEAPTYLSNRFRDPNKLETGTLDLATVDLTHPKHFRHHLAMRDWDFDIQVFQGMEDHLDRASAVRVVHVCGCKCVRFFTGKKDDSLAYVGGWLKHLQVTLPKSPIQGCSFV